jgi:membrane-associated phospholipid phosphatase
VTRGLAALAAVGLALGFVASYLFLVCTPWGQAMDVLTFRVVYELVPGGWVANVIAIFARAAVVYALAALVLIFGAAAVGRHAWAPLLAAMATVAVSLPLGLWLREDVLVRPQLSEEAFPQNSMPSNHATAAAALVVAVLLLWPPRRPWWLANTAGVVLLLVAVGNIVSQAHRPSDVVASFLLVGAVAAATLALVGPPRSRRQPPSAA